MRASLAGANGTVTTSADSGPTDRPGVAWSVPAAWSPTRTSTFTVSKRIGMLL